MSNFAHRENQIVKNFVNTYLWLLKNLFQNTRLLTSFIN